MIELKKHFEHESLSIPDGAKDHRLVVEKAGKLDGIARKMDAVVLTNSPPLIWPTRCIGPTV